MVTFFSTVCSGCNNPQLCYLPDASSFPAESVCCNFYDGAGMCVAACPADTVANDRECVTECPAGLYNVNVSGVCGKCMWLDLGAWLLCHCRKLCYQL